MSMQPPETLTPLTQLRGLAVESESEIERLQTELREVDVLLRQTNGEIERLQQRQQEATSRLRQIEANFESFSRQDIRQSFSAERDAQLRLVAMRSQLDVLQSKQRYLDRYIQQLHRLGDLATRAAERVEALSNDAPTSGRYISDHQAVIDTIEAQEQERQRLAQQMHDGPAQSMTNFILQAEIAERLFYREPSRAREELSNLRNMANLTFQRVRDFIFSLRPMMLDDLGLVPTLRRYSQSFESKAKLPVDLNLHGERSLPNYLSVTVFRSLQELLQNVADHAHAKHVQVLIDLASEPLTIVVEDDGQGFDAAKVMPGVRSRGRSGLSTLENRVEMLGGKILYQSTAGRGTRVRVEIPTIEPA